MPDYVRHELYLYLLITPISFTVFCVSFSGYLPPNQLPTLSVVHPLHNYKYTYDT